MFTLTRTVCSRLTHVLAAWGDGIRDGRTIAQSYDALARLSRRDLARRGLTRSDISRLALTGGS